MNYEKLRLREPGTEPTDEVLKSILGASYGAYTTFLGALAGLELENEWKFYNCSCKSWLARGVYRWTTPRGAKKEKNLYWLSAWDGYFKVAVWFLDKNRGEVLKLNTSEQTKKLIRDAKTLGKMMTFPVECDITTAGALADVYALIKCKKNLEA